MFRLQEARRDPDVEGSSGSIWQHAMDLAHGPVDPTLGSQGHVLPRAPRDASSGVFRHHFAELENEARDAADPVGAADRQFAALELAPLFNVIPNGAIGTAEQNQVSRDEYERIVKLYSDIRLGRTDLQFGAKPAHMAPLDFDGFKLNALDDIANLLQTESGRGLVGALAHAPVQRDGASRRVTTIEPRMSEHVPGQLDPRNASGGGANGRSGNVVYVSGEDTDATGEATRSDITLYHEMTHAYHAVYNDWAPGKVDTIRLWDQDVPLGHGPDRGIQNGEYQAVGLGAHAHDAFTENRYRYERRRIGAQGAGARTRGAETDAAMTHRDTYTYDGTPRTTPATRKP